jgi:CheY-like chemotaxis protein
VLVVDDNITNCRILEEFLTQWGMRPITVFRADAALALMLQEHKAGRRFALILLDAHMPDVDGFTLARVIKENPVFASAAIMMLSSADLHGDALRCREIGVDLYLVKPITQTQLCRGILKVLQATPQPELSSLASALAQPLPDWHRPLRILLAEDNETNQKVAASMLEKQGHSVTVAPDGRQAVEAHSSQSFDLILMDVQMPEVGGLEATRTIREREKVTGGHVPIVALTAHALIGDRERCLEAGMDDYLSKPIRAAELFEKIEKLLAALAFRLIPSGGR